MWQTVRLGGLSFGGFMAYERVPIPRASQNRVAPLHCVTVLPLWRMVGIDVDEEEVVALETDRYLEATNISYRRLAG